MKNLLLSALTFATTFAMAELSVKPGVINPACSGTNTGGIELYVTGAELPLTFSWSNSLPATSSQSELPAGNYEVTVTDHANNTVSATVTIVNPNPISVSTLVTAASASNINDGAISMNVEGGTPGYTYIWNNASTNENLWDIPTGDYSVTITDAAGCSATASNSVNAPETITSDNNSNNGPAKVTLGVLDVQTAQTVVYPNPAFDHITVKSNNDGNAIVRLTNIAGQLVYQQEFNSNEVQMNVANLAIGNYVMEIKTSQGETSKMVSIAR